VANELKHGSVGTELTQAEWEGIGTHVVANQAVGDIVYADTTSQLLRLGIGSTNDVLRVTSGKPEWAAPAAAAAGSLTGSTLASGVTASSLIAVGTIATGVWQGTDVGVAYGGTGVSTLASNKVLTGNGASAITAESNLNFDGSNLDLNNQGSIINIGASGNDWTQNALSLAGGSAAQVLTVQTTGTATRAAIDLKVAASSVNGDPEINFIQGSGDGSANNMQYHLRYDSGGGDFRLRSEDIDGSGGLGNVFVVNDGTNDMQFTGGISTNNVTPPTTGILVGEGNVRVGASTAHGTTAGTNLISLFNGTAPAGTLTDGASFFCASGEMKVIDAAGNITTLSPHDDEGRWVFHSQDSTTGKVLHIKMEQLMRRLDEDFGGGFIEEFVEAIGV